MAKTFPSYQQLNAMDCGATCLRIICKHYGRNFSPARLRDLCHTSQEGVSMLAISEAAEKLGMRTAGVRLTWEQLEKEASLPCIVHWNQSHFVVVYRIAKGKVYVSDPGNGTLLEYPEEDFRKCWLSTRDGEGEPCGLALLIEPSPAFYREEDDKESKEGRRLSFRYLLKYLRPYKSYIVQLLLSMLVGSVLSLIMPFVSQNIVDVGVGTSNLSFVVVMLIAQLLLTLGEAANGLIRSWLMLHMTTRVSVSLISDFLGKLMRLPIAFFDSRKVGDIMQRIGDYSRIQSFLTETLLSIVMAAVTFIIYGCVMAGYNGLILAVFLVGSALYIGWVLIFLKRRRKLDYMRFQAASANQSNLVQMVTGMQEIKLNNCEKQKRWEWEGIQAKLFKVSIKSMTLGQTQSIGGQFIDQIKNVLISFLAAAAVIRGDMTLGMMTAVQYIIGQLNAPISQFITFVQQTQDARISLERLNEIHERPDEEPEGVEKARNVVPGSNLELRNVWYRYEGEYANVLQDINLVIPGGKVTAIVGASGSGKTTLLKLLLGFYPPTKGEVLLNGRALSRYSDSYWRSQCGVVMQEGFIFSDTILANIAVSDEDPDLERVRKAVEIANIGDFIESLPLGYHTKIGMEGHGLSTGQRQRLLIARAAYKNAPYLFFDEATNSLDANNERVIMDRLNTLFSGKTVVIVAHRLSTVKNADNLVVLDGGRIVESGTHAELIARRGAYYQLVKNQLELGN